MIEILLFARLREQVGTGRLQYSPQKRPATVESLVEELRALGDEWEAALDQENLLCAVNQHQANWDQAVAPGDEVAFYPPVTGG